MGHELGVDQFSRGPVSQQGWGLLKKWGYVQTRQYPRAEKRYVWGEQMITGCLGESTVLLPCPVPAFSVSPILYSLQSHLTHLFCKKRMEQMDSEAAFHIFCLLFLGFFVSFFFLIIFFNKKFIANIEIDFIHTGISELRKNNFVPFSFKTGKERERKRKKRKEKKKTKK